MSSSTEKGNRKACGLSLEAAKQKNMSTFLCSFSHFFQKLALIRKLEGGGSCLKVLFE